MASLHKLPFFMWKGPLFKLLPLGLFQRKERLKLLFYSDISAIKKQNTIKNYIRNDILEFNPKEANPRFLLCIYE